MAFATTDDIATSLQKTLSSVETDKAELLLPIAEAIVTEAAGKGSVWADELDPVPEILKFFTIELVLRGMPGPGVTSASEALGAYSRTERYRDDLSSGLLLTAGEERLIREAVYGTLSGSSTPRALPDRMIDLVEGRDVDEVEAST